MPLFFPLFLALQASATQPQPVTAAPQPRPCTITVEGHLSWQGLAVGDATPRFIARTDSFKFQVAGEITTLLDPKGPVAFQASRALAAGSKPTGSYSRRTILPEETNEPKEVLLDQMRFPFLRLWFRSAHRRYPLSAAGTLYLEMPANPRNQAERMISAPPSVDLFPQVADGQGGFRAPEFKFDGQTLWLLEGKQELGTISGQVVYKDSRTTDAQVTGSVRVHLTFK